MRNASAIEKARGIGREGTEAVKDFLGQRASSRRLLRDKKGAVNEFLIGCR